MKKILFITGTRADFGKIKRLISVVEDAPNFEYDLFVTGMHELGLYGSTFKEVINSGFKNYHRYINQHVGEPMELILANTIAGLSRYISENACDMIMIHGDRVEALAGAIVGTMKNILVGHIEGGERSGTVDEMIRHAVTKLSHIHFVCNAEAANRVKQMGENPDSIYIIGSPDIDIMVSGKLPSIEEVKQYYNINFLNYAIVLFHPITTELELLHNHVKDFVDALIEDNNNYIVIYPNNDEGSHIILNEYERFKSCGNRFKVFPSIKFERFLTLLKHANFCIGNSSAGIREAPIYGIPTINIGTRQSNRYFADSIININNDKKNIIKAISNIPHVVTEKLDNYFGEGDSADKFMLAISDVTLWKSPSQKMFYDLS